MSALFALYTKSYDVFIGGSCKIHNPLIKSSEE